jgi:hypothetical protein
MATELNRASFVDWPNSATTILQVRKELAQQGLPKEQIDAHIERIKPKR